MPQTQDPPQGSIDFPAPEEQVVSLEYSIRLSVPPEARSVQVSIDDAAWQECRHDGHHWWYDWSRYASGAHRIAARAFLPEGPVDLPSRRVDVRLLEDEQPLSGLALKSQPVRQFSVVVPNEPGMMAKVTQLLSWEEVNIEGVLTESLGDMASIRFLADQGDGLRRKLESAGFPVVESQVFHLEIPNRPGELNKLARILADEKIDIRYLYGTSHGNATRMVLAVDQAEPALRAVTRCGAVLVEPRR